jgi:hypothetical protein
LNILGLSRTPLPVVKIPLHTLELAGRSWLFDALLRGAALLCSTTLLLSILGAFLCLGLSWCRVH